MSRLARRISARGPALAVLLLLALAACAPPTPRPASTLTPPVTVGVTRTLTVPPAATLPSPRIASSTPRPAPSATASPAPSPTPIAFYEPAGCQAPPDLEDSPLVEINGWTLDARTVTMLEHAQALYGGPVDLLAGVTQGSYHDNGSASFGTHLGGGAVDLSIFLPNTWTPDTPNLLRLVRALRAAGFAAWVRDLDEVYPGSGLHIHAVALGDPNLSEAAEAQLTGPAGYLRGFDGLPNETPRLDRYGGPVLCAWMIEAGYADLRQTQTPPAWPPVDWQERLKTSAEQAVSEGPAALAVRLGTVPAYLEGPLAGWLLREAGLLPPAPNPARRPLNFLLSPEREVAFWSWFSDDDYRRYILQHETGITRADLALLGPLAAGDLLLLYAGPDGGVSRAWVVTETRGGQAFGLAARRDERGEWSLTMQALDGPDGLITARTYSGITLLRRVEGAAAAGRPVSYTVQPGDTLAELSARFAVPISRWLTANPHIDPSILFVGQKLRLK